MSRLATAFGASFVLLLGALVSTAAADNGDLGNGTLSTGEGEGTLPASRSGRSGLVLLGELQVIMELVEEVSGDGDVTLRPLDPSNPTGTVVVFFEGDLEISLNRAALDDGRVAFGFFGRRFAGGLFQLTYGDVHLPVQRVGADGRIALPLARAYDPDVLRPEELRLRVLNDRSDHYGLLVRPVGRGLRLIQRTDD